MDRDSIEHHAQNWWNTGYTVPQMIQDWPAHGDTSNGEAYNLAPYVDVNNNGKYDPQNGDRPIMRGDRAIYFITNDIRGPHDSTDNPLGVEIHGMVYAFDCPSVPALEHSVLIHYDFINRSSTSYDSTMIGHWSDFDIGCNSDDYIGTDVERGIAFGYNGSSSDCQSGSGYDSIPPATGSVFLKGPKLQPNNIDDVWNGPGQGSVNGVGFGDGVADNEHWGMQHAYYYARCPAGPTCNPQTNKEFYNYMTGSWRDCTRVTYGGDGYKTNTSPSDTFARFMFPDQSDPRYYSSYGDTVNVWNEATAGNFPGDRRVMASTGPGVLNPGDTMSLDMAYVVGQDSSSPGDPIAPVHIMKERVDSLRSYFLADSVPCSDGSFTSVEETEEEAAFDVGVYPNPSKGRFHVELESETQREYRYALYSMRGALIDEGNWQGGGKRTLELGDEKQGVYFLRISSEQGAKVMKLVKE